MTPRSQLQPGQGISRYLTPETRTKSQNLSNKKNPYPNFNDENSRCLFIISRWWLIWCYPVCFLLGWYLQLSPLARTLRGARRESSEEWAAFIGVKSDYSVLSFLLRVHHTSALGDTEWPSPGHRPRLTPTTYTELSRESPDPHTRYHTEYDN